MESNKQQPIPIFELLDKNPSLNLFNSSEAPESMGDLIREVFDELQRSNEQLRDHITALQVQNKDLEAYAIMVAHDLKDPLSAMVLTSDLITKIPNMPHGELKVYLEQIRSIAYQMDTIINALLFFAKVSMSEAPVGRVDMDRVVKNVRVRLSDMIREFQAQLDLPSSWPSAIGYAPWLEEVWANYISNALRHGGRPPHVELGAFIQTDGMVRFWARDNGPGVLPIDQVRLFMPFSQIGPIDSPGQGLGLSIVHRIVEKLGGQVGVESETGKGSQFFFTLPADQTS